MIGYADILGDATDNYSVDPGTRLVAERPKPRKQMVCGQAVRPVPIEDVELIERVKAGQTEAYGKLVRKYQDRVFNTCWRICGHLEDARDLTQEAFLKAFEGVGSFRKQSGFYTWLCRIAVNLALSSRRSAKTRRTLSLEHGAGTQAEELARHVGKASGVDPQDAVSDAELQGCVARALQTLDDDHRAVVVLRDIEGIDYREIGEILEIPPGTVKSRLHRARMTLREAILPSLQRQRQER